MINILGYIGGILLGLCGLPETWRTIKDKRCHIGWGFLLMWYFGEIFMLIYTLKLNDIALIGNYGFNILLISIMLYFKIRTIKWKTKLR
jgi:uncharacterized protein with PQ loop repeat